MEISDVSIMKTGFMIYHFCMKKNFFIVGASLLTATSLLANSVNITVADGQSASGYIGTGIGGEDNETEPGTIIGDQWDLEAFGYDSSSAVLSLVGTYNFQNGENYGGHNYSSGAVFIRGTGNASWTYAYVLNFVNNTYQLFNNFTTLAPSDIPSSGPWSINTGTANLLGNGSFTYATGLANPLGFGLGTFVNGITHNEIDLSLGLLSASILNSFDAHFTISCGNDDLEGHYTGTSEIPSVSDGGLTALLLGLGMSGLIFMSGRNLAVSRI